MFEPMQDELIRLPRIMYVKSQRLIYVSLTLIPFRLILFYACTAYEYTS